MEDALFHSARVLTPGEDKALAGCYAKLWADSVDPSGTSPEGRGLQAARAVRAATHKPDFAFVISGIAVETSAAEAAAVLPAVALQLSVDACARTFAIGDSRIGGNALPPFARLLSGGAARTPVLGRLSGRLGNPVSSGCSCRHPTAARIPQIPFRCSPLLRCHRRPPLRVRLWICNRQRRFGAVHFAGSQCGLSSAARPHPMGLGE
jgi:hypothetical protein